MKIRLHLSDEKIEGLEMPSDDPKFIVVKLDSGYNIGVKKSSVKKIEKLGDAKKSKVATPAPKKGKGPKITILHTGGTIASKVDYSTGAVTSKFDPAEILTIFPELAKIAQIDSRLIRNIMSENMRFEHYNLLAKEVEKEVKKGAKGVIITHGTDTLHMTSAALSFALENVPIPVLLVGSQRSSDRPSTDAYVNLISAAMFIANTDFKGVGICMHEGMNDDTCLVMHGCKVRKMHTSRRDAFRPINTTAIARVNYEKKTIKYLSKYNKAGNNFAVKPFNPKLKVGFFKVHPHMYASELDGFKGFDGLLLELYALGQGPIIAQDEFMKENDKIKKAIASLAKKMPVAAASQCLYGRVDMNVYSEGREMQNLGVIGNDLDMTPETAFIKLAWLLSTHKNAKLFSTNLRGEISERVEKDTFLV